MQAASPRAASASPMASPAPSPSPLPAPLPPSFNPLEGAWSVLEVGEGAKKPVPRYEQGAAIIGSKLYVVGGHYGARRARLPGRRCCRRRCCRRCWWWWRRGPAAPGLE